MERTKYTPKRLLSLLLALIMLLGMFPTATLAAGTGDEPVVTPYVKTFEGLTFEFTLDVPERPFFRYGEKRVDVHYTITKSNDNNMVSELTEFKNGEVEPVNVTAKASDEKYSAVTHKVVNKKGENVKVFDPGTVLASGNFTYIQGIADGDVDANGKLEFVFYAKFIAAWKDQDGLQHSTGDYVTSGSVDVAKIRVSNLQAGYSVSYNDGGYTGAAGIPKEVEYTTGDNALTQTYTLPLVTPTLAGCTFKGWRSNEWKKTDEDGHELTGDAALFQPGDTVEKVPSDTVLTAVWKENASEHKVEFYHNFPDGSDETLFTTVHVADGEGAENPGAPYKHPEGYTFKDWCVKAEVGGEVTLRPYDFAAPVTEDIELYADWTADTEKFTVKWDGVYTGVSNLPATTFVVKTDNTQVQEPSETPMREGYAFAGWAADKNSTTAVTFPYAISGDTTFYALWTRNKVRITWPSGTSDGELLTHPGYTEDASHSTMVDVGSTVTFRVQWYKEYDPATVLANDLPLGGRVGTEDEHGVTYTYQFTANEDTTIKVNPATRKTFTITLPSANGCDVTFADCQSWRRGRDISAANGSTSYTFEYGDKFKVKLDVFADTRATLRVDGTAELSNVDGNGDNPTQTTREFTVDHAYVVTVSARAVVTRMVTFSLEPYGSIYSIQYVENGSALTKPADPKIPGYNFGEKWTTKPNGGGRVWDFANDNVTSNLVLYGQLTPMTYAVNYEANANGDATVRGIPTTAQTKTHGEPLTLTPADPTRAGHTFKGWATSPTGPVAYQPGGQYLNDAPVTLYAVWEKLTYTVTISAGTGYSTVPSGTATVEWGETFTLAIKVDASHSSKTPTIKYTSTEGGVTSAEVEVVGDSTATELQWTSGHPTPAKPTTWYYKIENVHKDYSISISIDPNDIYPVSFYAVLGDGNAQNGTKESAPFLIQSVEHGYYASMPAAPEREGYKFDHWERDNVANTEVFSTQITAATEIRAVYKAIVPKITVVKVKDANNGWELKNWQAIGKKLISFTPSDNKPYPISYGDDVTFDLVIQPGYDYSKLSVSANGYELGRENIKTDDKGVTTISFRLVYVTANTRITVSGIERKTITVTYNENALDHVSNLPAPQTANYYISGDRNNTNFTDQVPIRNGYTFLGWSTDGSVTAEDFKNATEGPMTDANAKKYFKIEDIKNPGVEIPFTADTTVYAIWEAQKSTVTLTFGDTALHAAEYDIQYEGKTFTLNAEFNAHVKGTAIFYVGKTTEKNAAEKLGEVAVNGKTASYSTSADKYLTPADQNFRYYWVEFQSEKVEGYTDCEAGPIKLKIFSRAITWTPLGEGNKGTLTIKDANGGSAQTMTAGQTYTLTVNTDKITGLECVKPNDAPVLGKHYKIVWQYKKTATSDWETVPGEFTDTNEYQVTPGESGYEFRAKIYPMGELYNKAVKFENNAYVANQYDVCLYTNTTKSVKENTEIALTTDAEDEANTVVIKNGTPFETLGAGSHKAQFEGQTITLVAKVTKEGTQTGVESGSVEFYQKKGNDWTLIATVPVQPEGQNMGVAAAEATMSAYTDPVAEAKDEFYAKYVPNETYETSTTKTTPLMVYIKSAQLQIPVIADVDSPVHTGKLNDPDKTPATATTYQYDLTGLTAGIKHMFQLKQTGANQTDKADWSVVALDGRTVADGMYTMKWETLTDANWKTTTTTGTTYTAETTKVGDRYHILLTGAKNSPFDGSKVVSKDIAIGDPQGVTVTVEAIDAIKATEVDRNNDKYPDVYQLNEITLTATVEAAEAGADRKPTGTVAFYYVDENNAFQPLGEAELKPDTSGKMVAQITTDELPVETKTKANTKLDSMITAVYYGDETFKPSENWDEANKKVTDAEVKDAADKYLVKSDTVTVYSSVVYNCTDENKNQTTDGERGIHISKADGLFLANESATLKLSDVYTLDWELGDDLRDIVAKLNPNKDYTIQWQKLTGVSEKENRDFARSERWEDITGATGTTLLLKPVEQDTAYRAVITVKDPATPIVKGSFELIDQGTVNTKDANDGRQVYYSNVMMPTSGEATIAVAVNTNERGDNLEGITEGETVTVNVLVSGAVGAVPNATLNVTITADDTKGNETNYKKTFTSKATVDGWNAFEWDTVAEQVQPGFYTLTVVATSNTGYMTETITRSLIVRESSYKFNVSNLNPTYNGRTQGVSVALDEFHFNGSDIDAAAAKSWTVKYYDKVTGKQVEPSQAGTYTAKVTLPASAYWTEKVEEFTFTIEQRKVCVEDAVAQAKVYDGKTNVNLVEVILNDAVTNQTTGLPTGNTGIINGDSIYATATGTLRDANAGENEFTVSDVQLHGDDADNYVVDGTKTYEEPIYVSRSQVYGETGTLKLKQGEHFPADQVIKMIDQAGNELKANEGYTLTFYYHSDTKIEKTEDLSKTGLYTVVARPKQDNYKGGVTMKFEVVKDAAVAELTAAKAPKSSTLIDLTNTATMYNPMGNVGVTATSSQDNTVEVKYQNGTDWSTDVPANAGRYLVKATDAISGDVAYGIYTITKAHPGIRITAEGTTYNSMPYDVATKVVTENNGAESYLTYAGDVAIGFDTPTDGNVAEQAPVDAGSYVVTLHVNETQNYTAHEVSAPFVIAQKPLTITTHSKQSTQYDAFPAMTAKYEGLAYSTSDNTNDTSLRDVQIAPEFLFNYDKGGFTNHALDQVGGAKIKPADALAKNYVITYVDGEYTRQRTNFKPDLAIYGLPVNGNGENVAYYGDEVQLYHYGYYTDHENGSSVMRWSVKKVSFEGEVTVGEKTGILNVNGVGTFEVTLKRGEGEQAISTTVTVTAIKKELGVHLLDQDKVYTGSNQDYSGTVTVYDELYKTVSTGSPVMQNVGRTDIGTQLPSGQVPAAETYYQSLIYHGKYTINDKEAAVAPKEDTHIYGQTRQIKGYDDLSNALINGLTASQTDDYNRLDVHDGYEILVAGTENMNYNVKYVTDQTAKDSAVTTYGGVKFTSETTEYLNDATVYGETPNVLDWTLEKTIKSTRGSKSYADNLADFDLESIFVEQDYDNCVGNADCGKFDYKAANRTTTAPDTYNVDVLGAKRTAANENAHPNYTLKFKTVTNSGALNYQLTDAQEGNKNTTTNALRAGSLGYDGGNATLEAGENFVEGSANIAQRPVTVKKASTIGTVRLYWRLPQSKLYTALLNILEAEGNSTNRGLAKGHTIRDLDLTISIQGKPIDPNSNNALEGLTKGDAQVVVKVGDTNYVLDGDGKIDGVELKTIQIEATYTTKTATNFVVLIKVRNEDGRSTTPLKSADGLTYEILRKVNGSFDGKVYATGSLTYTGRTATDKFGDECGVFTASYGPLSNIGGTYFIQMYEYGVALKTENS